MAPPTSAAPPIEQPLKVRLTNLAQTLQFAWFVGHLTMLLTTLRYSFAIVKFSASSTSSIVAYRIAFLSAAATYGIVVYKAYRARFRSGTMPTGQQGALKILGDENVQYLLMAFCWLYSKPVFFALLPFAVYSTFHFLSYLRTNIIPTVTPHAQPAFADGINRFVKKNYDTSMHLVANLELLLWARIFLGALILQNSWILLALYTVFLRARCAQSVFVRDALSGMERRGDALALDARLPEGLKNAWGIAKTVVRQFGGLSDVAKVLGTGPKPAVHKE